MTRSSHPAENFPAPDVDDDAAPLGRIVRNSAFNALGTVLIVPFNFLALFMMAHRLGPRPVGTFFTIFAISAVIHWIADAGTSTVLTRRVSRHPGLLKTIVPEAVGVLLVVCMVSTTLFTLVAAPWMAYDMGYVSASVIIVAVVAMASRHALDFAANILRGLERFEFENLSRVLQTASFCLFVWLWVSPENGGALSAFIAFAASNIIAAALIWAVLLTKWSCAGFHLSVDMISRWWRESIPLGIGDVIRQFLMQMDTLLLTLFRPLSVVGLFSLAARPLQPLQLVPRIIVSVLFPTLSRTAHTDRAAFSRMFSQTTSLLWSLSLPVSIFVSICATPLIVKTAGRQFADAALPLQILIWSTGLIFVNAQLRFVFTALDAERTYWRLICWILAAKIVLQSFMIWQWGMLGAAIGSVLVEAVLCFAGLAVLRRMDIASPSWLSIVRVVPAAVTMALVLWPFTGDNARLPMLAVAGVLSGLVYVAVALASGVWPWSDVMRIWGIIRRPAAQPSQ